VSDFSTAVKYLRLTPVNKVTPEQAEAAQQLNGSSNPSKYLSLVPTRALSLVESYISIPPYVPDFLDNSLRITGRMLTQWTVKNSAPFFILNTNTGIPRQAGILCVRYRVNEDVHRYAIYGNQAPRRNTLSTKSRFQPQTYFQNYTNQVIGAYCVFEYWFVNRPANISDYTFGLPHGFTVKTSILSLPISSDDTGIITATNNTQQIADLGTLLPEVVPTPQDALVYLSN